MAISFYRPLCGQFSGSDFANIIQTEQYLAGELPDLGIPLSGAIDAIADGDGQLKVVDYKTGRPPLPDWRTTGLSDSKKIGLHFYRQQLLFYKLLADGSRAYGRKQQAIKAAELVFVEPSTDTPNGIVRLAIASFDNSELQRLSQLIAAVYRRILAVDLPDTTAYSRSLAGIEQFEADLLK